jgi:hypothetical protein
MTCSQHSLIEVTCVLPTSATHMQCTGPEPVCPEPAAAGCQHPHLEDARRAWPYRRHVAECIPLQQHPHRRNDRRKADDVADEQPGARAAEHALVKCIICFKLFPACMIPPPHLHSRHCVALCIAGVAHEATTDSLPTGLCRLQHMVQDGRGTAETHRRIQLIMISAMVA